MVTKETKNKALALMRSNNPPSLEEISQKLKLPLDALAVWQKALRLEKAKIRLRSPEASGANDAAEIVRLKKEIEARDRKIAELQETVAGLSALLVKRG